MPPVRSHSRLSRLRFAAPSCIPPSRQSRLRSQSLLSSLRPNSRPTHLRSNSRSTRLRPPLGYHASGPQPTPNLLCTPCKLLSSRMRHASDCFSHLERGWHLISSLEWSEARSPRMRSASNSFSLRPWHVDSPRLYPTFSLGLKSCFSPVVASPVDTS